MPEIVTTNIHVSVDPETIREAVEAALNAHDDRADQLARKHARATDEIRTLKLQIKARSAMIESRARQRTEERIDFQRQITNLQEELRFAQSIIRKAGYGIHKFPCRLIAKDGSTISMRRTEDGDVEITRSAPGYEPPREPDVEMTVGRGVEDLFNLAMFDGGPSFREFWTTNAGN